MNIFWIRTAHRFATLRTCNRSTIRANQSLLSWPSKETRRTLDAPFEIRILQQCSIAQFSLKQFMRRFVENVFQENIQIGEVFKGIVFGDVVRIQFGQFTKWARTVSNTAIGNLSEGERKRVMNIESAT